MYLSIDVLIYCVLMYLYIHLTTCLAVYPSKGVTSFLSIYLPAYIYIYIYIHTHTPTIAYLLVTSLSFFLSIDLSIYLLIRGLDVLHLSVCAREDPQPASGV